LLAVVKLPDGSPVVQFGHFSVKEYLTSTRLAKAKDSISHFHISMTPAHTIVAQACLGVLLHLDENVINCSREDFPLAEYAAEHLLGHARFENVSSKVEDGMKRLFDPSERHCSIWAWVYDPEVFSTPIWGSRFPIGTKATSLHYAAFYGLHDIVAFLIAKHPQGVYSLGFDEETPLHVASRRGHVDVAQLLLRHGADANARDSSKCTPLRLALRNEHMVVARVLLEHGVDTEARDQDGSSALEWASEHGDVEAARVLLEHGADVNAQGITERTPLYYAEGEEVTRLLLNHGADVNTLDTHGWNPLHQASEFERVGAVRALLEHGVDANARDGNNATPLHLASQWGDQDVVRLLLQYGSDIHARNDYGVTPFMVATIKARHNTMDLLLEYGAEDHRL
jgi:ankyrin repeat protein